MSKDPLMAESLALLRQSTKNPNASFREGQWEAIRHLVEGRNRLLMVQRTGWGKSVVYFLATRLLRDRGAGPTLLVSPLLALMRNQIEAAERIGIRAATINSSNKDDWNDVARRLHNDEIDVLLISPERLANGDFRETVLLPVAGRIGMFVVDEAHCISDWGHDFRPDYRRITRILQTLPGNIPVLATTATATDRVVADVASQLGSGLVVMRGGLGRPSLSLHNLLLPSQTERLVWLAENLDRLPGSGIIYTLTIRDAHRVAEWLGARGHAVAAYTGQSDNDLRPDLENDLLANRLKALVATSALGMGFDKPDLGFVIHFQRPASVVHYYQQVGRAGRAIDRAYGILFGGAEDDDIAEYFLQNSFPKQRHAEEVLAALRNTDNGLSVSELERRINLRRGHIEHVLKLLSVETPSPVVKTGSKWFATPVSYHHDQEKIDALITLRRREQAVMRDYLASRECLMTFLCRELNDAEGGATPCGRCSVCLKRPLTKAFSESEVLAEAGAFLRRSEQPIPARKKWPSGALPRHGWNGDIPDELKAAEGRALCAWGDAEWGTLIRQGKQMGSFSEELVNAAVEMIQTRWRPDPFPEWVTCVPSLRHPTVVADFARAVAGRLGLPFAMCIIKVAETEPQKAMRNSHQQARNLDGVFRVDETTTRNGAVLLVDDVIDSGWTFTILAALLRSAGTPFVYPFALAKSTPLND